MMGYRYALNKQQANEIINEVNIRAYEFSHQLMMGFEKLDESEFSQTTRQRFPFKGVCCQTGESVTEKDYVSWCVPTSCPAAKPNKLQFKYNGKWIEKCCPAGMNAAAYYNAQNVQSIAGFFYGENEIAVNSGTYQKCQACSAGLIPNDPGDECV